MDLNAAKWRKSSHSADNGAQCVEVTDNLPSVIAVRDSKNPEGATLTFTRSEWHAFITILKAHPSDL